MEITIVRIVYIDHLYRDLGAPTIVNFYEDTLGALYTYAHV